METKIIQIQILNHGTITIELWPTIAPKAVNSIIDKIQRGVYDGRLIERLEPGFVIQPVFFDEGEFAGVIEPEFMTIKENGEICFERGIVAMAGLENQTSDGQFFITLNTHNRLNGHFTVVGKVISGYDEVERLENIEVIQCIDETSGYTYHQPKEKEIIFKVVLQ